MSNKLTVGSLNVIGIACKLSPATISQNSNPILQSIMLFNSADINGLLAAGNSFASDFTLRRY